MTVRRKTIVIIAITFLVLIAVVYGVARTVILRNARQNEVLSGNRNMQRILDVLDERMSSLNRFSLDRSNLDGAYDFMAHPNHRQELTLFGEYNRTNPAARRASFLILLDNSGHALAQRKLYLPDGGTREIPETLRSQLVPGSVLMRHSELTQSTSGVVTAPEGPLLIVSRAVLKTDGEGPSRGSLVVGRIFNRYDLDQMEKLASFKLTFQRLDQPDLSIDVRDALAHLSAVGDTYVGPAGDAIVWGYTRIDDLYGKPAFILRADIPRKFYQNGLLSQYYFLGSIIITGIVFCAVILLLLERMVVSPLSRLNRSVGQIAADGDV